MFKQKIPNNKKKFIIKANKNENVLFDNEASTSKTFSIIIMTSKYYA